MGEAITLQAFSLQAHRIHYKTAKRAGRNSARPQLWRISTNLIIPVSSSQHNVVEVKHCAIHELANARDRFTQPKYLKRQEAYCPDRRAGPDVTRMYHRQEKVSATKCSRRESDKAMNGRRPHALTAPRRGPTRRPSAPSASARTVGHDHQF